MLIYTLSDVFGLCLLCFLILIGGGCYLSFRIKRWVRERESRNEP